MKSVPTPPTQNEKARPDKSRAAVHDHGLARANMHVRTRICVTLRTCGRARARARLHVILIRVRADVQLERVCAPSQNNHKIIHQLRWQK